MVINITGKNMDLTDAVRAYVEEKISKLDQYIKDSDPVKADVFLEANKGKGEKWMKVEVTLSIPNAVIRCEELTEDLYGAIDLVQNKLERKLRQHKEKILDGRNDSANGGGVDALVGGVDPKVLEKVVKRKSFDLGVPISEDEAIDRMELLGHDFYFYIDRESGKQKIVYRRKDGGYGVIEAQ